ncbi:thioesterase II family protein [Acidobacterium sp. S8]|uniref:thioesterase II family protein n=1 Tax=Acidobacterium sp. S8 TaxID=1641854 RepID=UPI0021109F5D|nr:thioesterase domain-containing protein [Acidobacterium sp. S8]
MHTSHVVTPWIVRPSIRPSARIRLFCFPRAGGGVSSFRRWAEDCHPEIEIALIQPPGRENRLREEPLQSMKNMAESIADSMIEFLDKDYALFGHSLGGKVAFETARELRRRDLPGPLHIFAAASPGPAVPWAHSPVRTLGNRDLLQEIQQRYGGVPPEILEHEELCAILVPALRADMSVVETYQYAEEPPFASPITCLCGIYDSMTPESEASEWGRQTSAEFRLHMLPGDHFFPVQLRTSILDLIAADLNLQP